MNIEFLYYSVRRNSTFGRWSFYRASCPDGQEVEAQESYSAKNYLPTVNNFSGHDCCHWRAFEFASIEGSVARFAGGFGGAERPGVIRRKKRQVGRLSGG